MAKTTKSNTTKKEEQLRTQKLKAATLEALEKSLGIVTTACKKVDIARSTFYKWVAEDKDFESDVADMDNIALDFAESSLHKQIQGGVPASTIFYLKTRGKGRGYIERQEITGRDGEPLTMTPEEREARIAALEARAKKGK